MLILIDKSLELQLANICASAPLARLRGVTNLIQAHADSRHIVVAPPSICRIFEACPRLSEEHRAIARKIRLRFSELAELKNILSLHAEFCIDGHAPVFQLGVWKIPLEWVATHGMSETHLICEDLYDCEISHEAARDYLNANDLTRLTLTLDHTAGGGGNTHRVLRQKAIDSQRVSVCVVDSDRADPSDASPLGPTAANCAQVSDPGLYELFISTGRELENHLPVRLVDKVRALWHGVTPSQAFRKFEEHCAGLMLFADLKKGTKKRDIEEMTGTAREFWEGAYAALPHCAAQCCAPACTADKAGDCKQVVMQSMGRTLLKDARDQLFSDGAQFSPKRYRDYLPSPNDALWIEMGGRVAAYGASVKVAATM